MSKRKRLNVESKFSRLVEVYLDGQKVNAFEADEERGYVLVESETSNFTYKLMRVECLHGEVEIRFMRPDLISESYFEELISEQEFAPIQITAGF